MFLAVWLIYAADRLLDTNPLVSRRPARDLPGAPHLASEMWAGLQPRHRFPHTHLRPFSVVMLLAACVLAALVPTLPRSLLGPYLLLAALLAAWFDLIHLTTLHLPKEFVPGLFFAAAAFLPIPHSLFPAALFAALCTLNCLYIHHWEHPSEAGRVPHPHDSLTVVRVGLGPRPTVPAPRPTVLAHRLTAPADTTPTATSHSATTIAIRHLPHLTLAIALVPLLHPSPIHIAISLSALFLLALDHHRHHLSPTTLRAAADLALLTPILILPFLL